jgi:hypothetical protein
MIISTTIDYIAAKNDISYKGARKESQMVVQARSRKRIQKEAGLAIILHLGQRDHG